MTSTAASASSCSGVRSAMSCPIPGCPVAVDAAGAVAAGVMRVVQHPVDDGGDVLGHLHDHAPGGQLLGTDVDGGAGADAHRRRPMPAEIGERGAGNVLVDAGAGALIPAALLAVPGAAVQLVVDVAVDQPGADGDGTGDAVPGCAPEAGVRPAAVVVDPLDAGHASAPMCTALAAAMVGDVM